MNKFKIILIPLFLLIVSCTSNNEDENKKFNSFLNTEWENTLKENTTHVESFSELIEVLNSKKGFVSCYWKENKEDEIKIKKG